MASTINASSSGSGGLISTGDASGVLQLQNNGTVALTIDTSQQIGIGTASPSTWATKLVVYNNQLTVTGGQYDGSFSDAIFFAGNAEGTGYRHKVSSSISSTVTNSQLKISVSSGISSFVDALTMNGSGAVALSGGTKNVSGTGIVFPATQNASTNANTLDDYEEGSWTPSLQGTGSNPTVGYVGQIGYYVKVGGVVHCWFNIEMSSTSGGSGNLRIGGFPFVESSSKYSTWSAGGVGYFDSTVGPSAIMKESGNTVAGLWYHSSSDANSSINQQMLVSQLTVGGKYGYVSYAVD